MTRRLYNRFIKPRSPKADQAEREVVLNYLLLGTLGLAIIAWLDTLLIYAVAREDYLLNRTIVVSFAVLLTAALYLIVRRLRYFRFAAFALTSLIAGASIISAYWWSILIPTGLLLFSLAVVMAGILIGARYSLYMACGIVAAMVVLQQGQTHGQFHPDLGWVGTKPTIGDVVGFSAVLLTIALVSWLFNRQMELSLRRARRSEKALQRERDLLEIKVEQRAKQLEASQLEKMQQIYRFAELGRLSTALFHDLANHLSSVSVDIEGLSTREQSAIMRRISENVGHIDSIVKRVRQQLRGQSSVEVFNVLSEINEVLKILAPLAEQANVVIRVDRQPDLRKSLSYKGDITRFRQIIINLVANAIEAYESSRKKTPGVPTVNIELDRKGTDLTIKVTDQGKGIPPKDSDNIFRPFYTTKHKGSGIGLFIVKQIVEQDFGGQLSLESTRQATTFTVTLPRSYYARQAES
jgi:signal transduction histidine kinase